MLAVTLSLLTVQSQVLSWPVYGVMILQALKEHCSLTGHAHRESGQEVTRAPKGGKQKSLAAVQPAVPLELTVQPIADSVEMERCSALHLPMVQVYGTMKPFLHDLVRKPSQNNVLPAMQSYLSLG